MKSIKSTTQNHDYMTALSFDPATNQIAFMSEKMLSLGILEASTGEILKHFMFSFQAENAVLTS